MAPSGSPEPEQVPVPRRYCSMAVPPHLLKQPSRGIKDEHLFRFAQRINSEMRMGAPMCLTCYQQLKNIYLMKMANARKHKERREATARSLLMEISTSSSDPPPPEQPSAQVSAVSTTSSDPPPPEQPPAQVSAVSTTAYASDDDDPNSNLSLNAVNGTRLPHIQPIPKRRQFVHFNKNAMDIYLAGTTGGFDLFIQPAWPDPVQKLATYSRQGLILYRMATADVVSLKFEKLPVDKPIRDAIARM